MPRCEGRPGLDCPRNVNDDSVKFTQDDLFLCHECEEFRFPSSTNAKGGNRKGNRKPALSVASKPATKQSTTEVITTDTAHQQDVVIHDCTIDAHPPVVTHNLEAELNDLRQLVRVQQDEISVIRQQLEFVLSFLDIKRTEVSHPISADQPQPSMPSQPSADEDNIGTNGTSSWTDVVTRRHRPTNHLHCERSTQLSGVDGVSTQRPAPPQTLQESLLTAVYIDQSNQKRRSSSLIVSGLQPNNSKSDSLLFSQLVLNEFGLQPDITYIKRLGQPLPEKTRPLLVALRSIDQTQQIIKSARKLRQSENSLVRDGVYISPNLTKAEAAAAYQLRTQRRQAAQRRAQQSAVNRSQQVQGFSANAGPVTAVTSTGAVSLSALAPPFNPLSTVASDSTTLPVAVSLSGVDESEAVIASANNTLPLISNVSASRRLGGN